MQSQQALEKHLDALRQCRRCPQMLGPVVTGQARYSPVMLVGQAPGEREGTLGRPFAWTAGKTLFGWFDRIGLDETAVRRRVYMAAVCRCFPGKRPRGGDRVPSSVEIEACSTWLDQELAMLRPRLLIPVGKLAIAQWLPLDRLVDVIGRVQQREIGGRAVDLIPLPHPSGASTWHRTEPGRQLLAEALALIAGHEAWRSLVSLGHETA